jgi:iron complex outermembrane receptor protein/vitamin B12 transporter
MMPALNFLRSVFSRAFFAAAAAVLPALFAISCPAASIRGVVTDATGAKVTGASVSLFNNGKVIASAASSADGSFEVLTGASGRFFLVISAKSFRELQTPDFYAGQFDSIERNIVLEPEWVRESIVVTATGTPTPQPQTSAATSVLSPLDLALSDDFVSVLRLMPGTVVSQAGQCGSQTSLFVRGGNSDANKILVDGIDAGDLGNLFDLGPLSPTGVERTEVYRGTDSDLYGAGAETGVVSLTTPHGTTNFPSFLFEGDAGDFSTSREQLEIAGSHRKLDYLGAVSWLQTANDLPRDEYHIGSGAANIGWQLNGNTQLRGTAHYTIDGTGVPNAWDFYHIADNATQKDQNLYVSAAIDNQTTPSFHNNVSYGATRKREQYNLWSQSGSGDFDLYGDSLGDVVTITGANGYSVTGQAVLDGPGSYGDQLINNRDQLLYQGDIHLTPHLTGLIGFHFEDERGVENIPTYSEYESVERTNYDYLAAVHGDFKNRLYYSLGGSLERYSLFGTQTTPRAGISFYVLRPRSGVFSGTRILFNYGEGVREPTLTDQYGSLYNFLYANGGQASAAEFHVTPLTAPTARSYEGGAEQSFLSQHVIFRADYFHNEFGHELESVGAALVPTLLPNLNAAQQQLLQQFLISNFAYSLVLNSQAFRAQGVEASAESGIGGNIFLRGGYTYLEAQIQRSFTSDNQALMEGYAPMYGSIPIGAYSPLKGARPFRRPPHTGFLSAMYTGKKITGNFSAAFASRSDDSTYLEDASDGASMLLPNRNLDFGYAKLDLGGSYQLLDWMDIYAQADNLLDNQHIAPIGFPSLPFNIRAGIRIRWGPGSGH